MKEIVKQCTHGIDLHTGAIHRDNLPQIRANLDHEETAFLAESFGVPVLLDSDLRDGSLREAAAEQGIPMLLYEAGEALRFDEVSIRAGVRGVTNVMRTLKMIPTSSKSRKSRIEPVVARSSTWARAPSSGIMRNSVKLGERIKKGQLLAVIADPFGQTENAILAEYNGIVIGKTNLPLVNEGDALFHIARFGEVGLVEERVGEFQELHEPGSIPTV
jgi:predicted deacylase